MPENRNHPKAGSIIKVDPIRSLEAISSIKDILSNNKRDMAIFTLGINSALRASDIVSLKIGVFQNLKVGDTITIREKKTKKVRLVAINESVFRSLQEYVKVRPRTSIEKPLFLSRKGGPLKVNSLHRLVKTWCKEVGLVGNFGSHTLRKTFGYHQRVTFKTELPTLMVAFNHSSQRQTLDYLGVENQEVKAAFMNSL